MQHWIIDSDVNGLPTWREAFPNLRIVQCAEGITDLSPQDVIWCRLRVTDDLSKILAGVDRFGGHPIVVLSDAPDEAMTLQALAGGATGCCNSRAAPEVLRQVATVVSNGGLWVGQSLLQRLMSGTARSYGQRLNLGKNGDWERKLSEREREVARLVAGGASNKEIASRLSISERTVKAHLTAIFEKLGLRDRLQLSVTVNGISL